MIFLLVLLEWISIVDPASEMAVLGVEENIQNM